ncbi:MAG TPA: hypothetical protein DCY07_04760 [Rhodospirillaceae bacterium]|nr:hypothetical protein [Rhodospirillaceae bacterium]
MLNFKFCKKDSQTNWAKCTLGLFLVVGLLASVSPVTAQQASTDQDGKTGFIQFKFDGQASIKAAPRGTIANQSCVVTGGYPAGGFRYNTALKNMEYCDGTTWRAVGYNLQSSACTAATTGNTRYNDTTDTIEYCDGTAWSAIGSIPDNATCNAALRGATRFIPANVNLEYCDGSTWKTVGKTKLVVDYPKCKGVWFPDRWPSRTFPDYRPTYKARGAPDSGGITVNQLRVVCPPDMVIISTDNNTMSYAYCCPFKIE